MPNYYGIFFSGGSGGVIKLPVNPEKFPMARDNDNKEYNVLGIGPIMVPRTPKLREVTISSFFPGRNNVEYPNAQDPDVYISYFQSAMDNKSVLIYTPVRSYEDGTPFGTADVGFPVLVTSFDTEERGGEVGDFYYDLTVTEYRDYSPVRMQLAGGSSGGGNSVSAAAIASARTSASTGATTSGTASGTASAALIVQPSRDIPQGQLYVGALAIANGTCYQTSAGGGTATPVSGQRVSIARINNEQSNAVYVTTEDGTALGWIVSSGLQVVSET